MNAKKYWQEYKHTFYCKLKLYINVRFCEVIQYKFCSNNRTIAAVFLRLDPDLDGVLEMSRKSPQSARDLGARRRGADGVAAC